MRPLKVRSRMCWVHGSCYVQVTDDIRALHALAQRRRAARQAAGALRLDNTKLDFQLDAAGQPIGCTPHEQRCCWIISYCNAACQNPRA